MTAITSRYGIDNDTTLLTGFTTARKGYGGIGFEGSVPMDAAREMIGWEPIEAAVQGTYITDTGVTTVQDPSRKMLVHPRTGVVLGVNGEGYTAHPYEETLLDNAAKITDGELGIARVGTLKQGRKAFVQYEMTENIKAGGPGAEPVEFRPFLNAATSLDGSISTSYFTGSQVIICDNTLSMALKQAGKAGDIIKVRHTRYSRLNVQAARDVLKIIFEVADDFTDAVNALTAEFVSDAQWAEFVERMVPLPEKEGRGLTLAETKRESLNGLWNNDPRVAPWKNSAWGVLAATNTWGHHIQTAKGATRDERATARLLDGSIEESDALTLKVLAEVTA